MGLNIANCESFINSANGGNMKTYRLIWSPEGKPIAVVRAKTARAAIRKAPLPYRKYLGEIYAEEITE
jgi:hypothetical protein